jgi:hypothetical protein
MGDTILQRREDKTGFEKRYSLFTGKDENLLCVAMPEKEFINAHNCIYYYYYRTTPSFERQEPSVETIASIKGIGKEKSGMQSMMSKLSGSNKTKEDAAPYDPLYVWVVS